MQEVGLPKPEFCSRAPLRRTGDQIHKRLLSPLNKDSRLGEGKAVIPHLLHPGDICPALFPLFISPASLTLLQNESHLKDSSFEF